MDGPIRVLELATPDNLFPPGYVLANPDLQRVFGKRYDEAAQHFEMHGRREKRQQATRAYFEWRNDADRQRRRFLQFLPALKIAPWSPKRRGKFPLQFGTQTFDLADYQAESANSTSSAFAKEIRDNPDKLYVDVGAGLRDVVFDNCAYIEVYPSLTTDIIIEPQCTLPFTSSSLDGIGCFAVLEHVRMPWQFGQEFERVLKPGGKVFIDWPFLQPVHGFPSHYYNATREGTRALFESAFNIVSLETGAHQGPDFTFTWLLQLMLRSITAPELREKIATMPVEQLANEPPQSELWRRVIAALDDAAVSALSSGNSLVGIRKAGS